MCIWNWRGLVRHLKQGYEPLVYTLQLSKPLRNWEKFSSRYSFDWQSFQTIISYQRWCLPAAPGEPVGPTAPVPPTGPIIPKGPVAPVFPIRPDAPVFPVEPGDPLIPGWPFAPIDPWKPKFKKKHKIAFWKCNFQIQNVSLLGSMLQTLTYTPALFYSRMPITN